MPIEKHESTQYTGIAQMFHWLIAALIVTQFALAWSADELPLGIHKLALLARHKSIGMTVLMLVIFRLLWRFRHPPPKLPADMSQIERLLARLTHSLLYVLLFAMPLTGWLMSSAKNYSVSWFGLFTWPNLITPNTTAFELLKSTHDCLSYVLVAVAVLHMIAALKHHFWNRDDVFLRMVPMGKAKQKRVEAQTERRI